MRWMSAWIWSAVGSGTTARIIRSSPIDARRCDRSAPSCRRSGRGSSRTGRGAWRAGSDRRRRRARAGCRGWRGARLGVLDGDDAVVGAPHDEGRRVGEQVESVVGVDALAAVVDDGADGVDERATVSGFGEAGVAAGGLDEAGGAGDAEAPAPLGELRAGGDEVAVGDERQHELGAGQRGGAEGQVDVGSEPAAGDEDEAGASLRVLVGELHGDAATERVADDGRAGRDRGHRGGRAASWRWRPASSRRAAGRIVRGRAGRERRRCGARRGRRRRGPRCAGHRRGRGRAARPGRCRSGAPRRGGGGAR